jgi:hypothetical protein
LKKYPVKKTSQNMLAIWGAKTFAAKIFFLRRFFQLEEIMHIAANHPNNVQSANANLI